MTRTRLTAERFEERVTPALGDLLQTLSNPNANSDDLFAYAVAVDGNLAVVGAYGRDLGGASNAGAAYVIDITTGALVATLRSPAPAESDAFGISVAISGTRVVVGAGYDDPGGVINAGSAYVFDISTGSFPAPLATLNNPSPAEGDIFGYSVAISGTRAVVGANFDDPGGVRDAGSAYLFEVLAGPAPAPLATLRSPAPAEFDKFGISVAISGTRVVVGAIGAGAGGVENAGSAFVFDVLAGPAPVLLATLNDPAPAEDDLFGYSVGIGGTRVVVGASGDHPGGVENAGSAFVFDVLAGPAPVLLATLNDPAPTQFDQFGYSVAISGTRVVVGMSQANPAVMSGAESADESAYVFDVQAGATPAPIATLHNPAPALFDLFGYSVGISGTRAVVGAYQDAPGGARVGTAYVFDTNSPPAAGDDAFTVPAGSGATALPVLGNDTAAPDAGEALSVTAVTQPAAGGVAAVVGSGLTFTPAAGFSGTATFTYTAGDGNGGSDTATVTVTVPPPPPPGVLQFTQSAATAGEGSGGVTLTVSRTGGSAGAISVQYATANGTALAPGDYAAATGTLTWADGDASPKSITVTVADDSTDEPDETFGVALSNAAGGATLGGTTSAAVTITDDDSPPPQPQPQPLSVGGSNGTVGVFAPAGGQFGTTPAAILTPFAGFTGQVRSATADVDGDGVADTVAVTGPGTPIRVAVISGNGSGSVLVPAFDPFGGGFAGGGFVAAADLDGDGKAEFVVTPDETGGVRVTIYSLAGGAAAVRANFLGIDDPNFRGGSRVALGDVNADGTPDAAVAAGFGGGPRVALFDGATLLGTPTRLIGDFFAFPGSDAQTLRNGVFVAAGDVDGDGFADLVFGGGPGGAPRVFVLSGALVAAGRVEAAYAAPVANFFVAGDLSDRGGARVAVTHADGDGRADVAVGSGAGRTAKVRVYLGRDFGSGGGEPPATEVDPFGGAVLADGVYVG